MRHSKHSLVKTINSLLFILVSGFISIPAFAHDTSTAYINIQHDAGHISGQLTGNLKIDLRDLQRISRLDSNGDNQLTWKELRLKSPELISLLSQRLAISTYNKCVIHFQEVLVETILDYSYAVFPFSANCPGLDNIFQIDYDLLFSVNQRHKALLKIKSESGESISILDNDNRTYIYNLNETSIGSTFYEFLIQGIWHIWIGLDHILFLLSLLLSTVIWRDKGKEFAQTNWKTSTLSIAKIVTAFTIAHSVTLVLAGLQLVSLPPKIIETAIAASVVIVALNNIKPFLPFSRIYVAFLFGLIHGFGFASVLTELNLESSNFITGLFSFNLGVELGQLAIVALFIPVGLYFQRTIIYPRYILPAASLSIAFMGILWIIERGFGIVVFPA